MTVHIAGQVPAPGMSRYEFTDAATGFHVITVECRTGESPREIAVSRSGFTGPMHCTHLSDWHPPGAGLDPVFYYGPDAAW